MSDLETRALEAFPTWLRQLSDDVVAVSTIVDRGDVPEDARRLLAGAVNYLFKSLDLVPDGIEDLGFMDDAFVLRTAASLLGGQVPEEADEGGVLVRLAAEASLVREFLGEDASRLDRFVHGLPDGVARGRTAAAIVTDAAARGEWLGEVRGWAQSYEAPSFSRDGKNLIKLKAFLRAKLPQ